MKQHSKTYDIRWADLDPYQHVRHTAYYDYCTQVRFGYFAENGFDQKAVERLGVGPVLLREEGRFLREVPEGDQIRIELSLLGLSPDGRRFSVRHDVYRRDGVKAAVVDIDGGWLDVKRRRFGEPVPEMVELLAALEHAADYSPLPDVGS